jgi:hypothetical protein
MHASTFTSALVGAIGLCACTAPSRKAASPHDAEALSRPLVLDSGEGESRIRRVYGGAKTIIKVDPRNGGSSDMMMGYEELPVRQVIPPHHHPDAVLPSHA